MGCVCVAAYGWNLGLDYLHGYLGSIPGAVVDAAEAAFAQEGSQAYPWDGGLQLIVGLQQAVPAPRAAGGR